MKYDVKLYHFLQFIMWYFPVVSFYISWSAIFVQSYREILSQKSYNRSMKFSLIKLITIDIVCQN